MAPTNFTDFVGDYDRDSPIKISPIKSIHPRDPTNLPLHRNPVFLVPLILVLAVLLIIFLAGLYIYLSKRVEKKRRERVEAEMSAAAHRAGIESGVSSFADEMIYHRGVVWHYNFQRREFENVGEPSTPHLQEGPARESSARVVGRVVGGNMDKVWKDFKKLFDRRS